jgi:hypothetical protein
MTQDEIALILNTLLGIAAIATLVWLERKDRKKNVDPGEFFMLSEKKRK